MTDDDDDASHILAVRRGPGANCSSIGSAVEMLFLSASAGAALVVAASALLRPAPEGEGDDPPADDPPAEEPPAEAR